MPKKTLTNEQKKRIAELASDGFSQTKIANLYDVSQGTISNVLKEKRYEGEIKLREQMMENAMTRGVEAVLSDERADGNNMRKRLND